MTSDLASATVNGAPFYYRPGSAGDRGVLQQVFEQRDYDLTAHGRQGVRLQTWLLRQLLPPLIVDVGANIGASAIWFRNQLAAAVVIAVEPEERNHTLLVRNTAHFTDVICVRGALAARPGTGRLIDPGRGDWGYQVEPTQDPREDDVLLYGMDDLLQLGQARNCVPYIAKLDIEGGEAEVFADPARCAWLDRFPLVIIELHDWMLPGQGTSRGFLRALAQHDFDVTLRGENLWCWNNRRLGG